MVKDTVSFLSSMRSSGSKGSPLFLFVICRYQPFSRLRFPPKICLDIVPAKFFLPPCSGLKTFVFFPPPPVHVTEPHFGLRDVCFIAKLHFYASSVPLGDVGVFFADLCFATSPLSLTGTSGFFLGPSAHTVFSAPPPSHSSTFQSFVPPLSTPSSPLGGCPSHGTVSLFCNATLDSSAQNF